VLIQAIAERLREQHPSLSMRLEGDTIVVDPPDDRGFQVRLREEKGTVVVGFDGWHEHFESEQEALACFAFGLGGDCRLKTVYRGSRAHRWTLEYKVDGVWREESTTGLLVYPFWRRPRTVFLTNGRKPEGISAPGRIATSPQPLTRGSDTLRAAPRLTAWLFLGLNGPPTPKAVIAWWERRRLPFNLIVGAWGILCLVVFLAAITTSGHLQPGEDAVEPLALLAAPFFVNVLYTLGWLVELAYRSIEQDVSPRFGPRLLKLGLGLGLVLCAVPALFWSTYRLLQWTGFAT
jgi:hypothetical protein